MPPARLDVGDELVERRLPQIARQQVELQRQDVSALRSARHVSVRTHVLRDECGSDVGAQAPEFRLRGPGGVFYTLSEYRGEKNVLLVFYPLAFSPVCSHQLPEIQKLLASFEKADTQVFGISVDSHWSNAAFARSLGLGFPLLSDWRREASEAFGMLRCRESEDHKEAARAFVEKRPSVFKGR
jgi:peroxiredoxin